ncbi:acyltransferase [Butyrivibrio sp. AE3004]|uniref:acyltransferase n=1 Tax=Butyrivibrio sp. AE3004 TaxID=1506994 RepID=UPI0004945CA6|nr:acyltransferase family protein [Butyrivibrio sp. AE3004]
MKEDALRQSNIELLRILATCGVIILHYNSIAGGGFFSALDKSVNQFILIFLESISICAVNVFVIITGFFLSKTNIRDFMKPLGLLAQVFVFAVLAFAIQKIIMPGKVTIDTFFEFLYSSNWYVYVFVALYLISPFINVMWNALNAAGKRILLAFSVFLFSIYPTFIDILKFWTGRQLNGSSSIGLEGSQAGYTIVNFILMYIIGAFIREMSEGEMPQMPKLLSRYFICLCLDMAWAFADGIRQGKEIYETVAWNYSNPFVIAEAAIVFMIFLKLNIRYNKIINMLAASSFTVYILHLRFLGLLKIGSFAKGNPVIMILHAALCVAGTYLICFVINYIYKYPAGYVAERISSKWNDFRKFSI